MQYAFGNDTRHASLGKIMERIIITIKYHRSLSTIANGRSTLHVLQKPLAVFIDCFKTIALSKKSREVTFKTLYPYLYFKTTFPSVILPTCIIGMFRNRSRSAVHAVPLTAILSQRMMGYYPDLIGPRGRSLRPGANTL